MHSKSENNNGAPGKESGETCQACHQYFDKTDECNGNYVPLTKEEEAILAEMREVKAEVGEVMSRLRDLEGRNGFKPLGSGSTGDADAEQQTQWLEHKQYLEVLRKTWQELDRKRQQAAKFRMKILGHED